VRGRRVYRHRGGNQAPSMPGRPAVSRVLFPRRGGPPRRGRRPSISTRRRRRALPGLACADRESGLPAVVGRDAVDGIATLSA